MIFTRVEFRGLNWLAPFRADADTLPPSLQLIFFLLFAVLSAHAQTFNVLHRFAGKGDGEFPWAGVMRDSRGNLYGTTQHGGSFDFGTLFKLDAHGKPAILHSFWGGDGLWPYATLIRDQAGNFYGTATGGGTLEGGGCRHGCGSVVKLDSAGKETVLYAFAGGADGSEPNAGVIRDDAGNLYGTTAGCGYSSCGGVVFKVDKNGKETVLHTFTDTPDGAGPTGTLIRDRMGNLYGMTYRGGSFGRGLVFKIDPFGKETMLYNFTAGKDGGEPQGTLLRDAKGNLYGVTFVGGDLSCGYDGEGCGAIFRLDHHGKETVLYAFKGTPDAAFPNGGLVRDKSGNLYGVTQQGGSGSCGNSSCGTVYKLEPNGKETLLHSFTGGSDGSAPIGSLTIDESGNLYGTTNVGGDFSCLCGAVFKITPLN